MELRSGRILHYLVSRSDPRLPGSSRWRLSPDRIVDQQPGRVFTALRELDDLPLARASVRQAFLQRSRRWRQQVGEETSRLRDQVQQVGDRFEERLEGWLEERPWEPEADDPDARPASAWHAPEDDPLEHWPEASEAPPGERPARGDSPRPRPRHDAASATSPRRPVAERQDRYRGRDGDDDPWI